MKPAIIGLDVSSSKIGIAVLDENNEYYKKEELPEIKQWLKENYKDSVKSVSFLLHSEHGFKQAPYEEITKEDAESWLGRSIT
jgi:hypothetical protein